MQVFHLHIVIMRKVYVSYRTSKEGSPELPWNELVYENQTLVLYMGLVGLERICEQLIAHGQRPDMPVALISKGTTPDQKVVVGTC
jgi:uroporphyrin-III C-methyltransferase/precorrin-2 dehydrogenase/sirohydrochlorin ferrochelatase